MDLSKYQQLSGLTVSSGKQAFVGAQLDRCRMMLETMLGYTLSPDEEQQNLYNELGKSRRECACPIVDTEELDDPDEVVGSYRLFPYNELDQFFHIDPFSVINKVKLVQVRAGVGAQGITLKTFSSREIRAVIGRDGFSKYLEHCQDCLCSCECTNCVQLAVDATWLWEDQDSIPDELLYILVDMVTWYSDVKRNIKSESITTHSYTKFDNTPPEQIPTGLATIRKYAGPNGTATVAPTTGGLGRGDHRVRTIGV